MFRQILVASTFLAVALSGCILGDADEEPGGEGPDTAPEGPSATFTAEPLSGIKPLSVEYRILVQNADNQSIDWSIDVDGDGAAEANGTAVGNGTITYLHTFDETGTYNATAEARHGTERILSTWLLIEVATDQVTQAVTVTRTFEYTSCSGPEGYIDAGKVPFVGDETDVDPDDEDSEKIPSRIDFKATKATWHQAYQTEWSFTGSFLEVFTFFTDSDGNIEDYDTDAGTNRAENLTLTGRISDPAVWVVLYACGGSGQVTVEYLTPRAGTE